jgi:hypothetical protein
MTCLTAKKYVYHFFVGSMLLILLSYMSSRYKFRVVIIATISGAPEFITDF